MAYPDVYCNRCGEKMRLSDYDETLMLCPKCDNEAYLDEEDPDNDGEVLQMVAKEDFGMGYPWDEGEDPELWRGPLTNENAGTYRRNR